MDIVLQLLKMFWLIFRAVLIPVCAVIGLIALVVAAWFLVFLCRGNRLQKGEHHAVQRAGFLKNLFYNFPVRYCKDLFARDPEYFRHQGCIIYTGRQGNGKTIAMVEQCMMWQKEYPKAKVITNLAYTHEDDQLEHWSQLIDYKNGIQGVICCIDEMQNWFSSNQSKDFPAEMLQVITQNRKNRRVIMGTAQCFNRLAKPIREQATEVRKCVTLFGCITIVHRVEPELDSNGDVEKWHHRGFYYFVHTDDIRDSYDTYKVIDSLRKSGFQPQQPITEIRNVTQVINRVKK
mgnify:FL=1